MGGRLNGNTMPAAIVAKDRRRSSMADQTDIDSSLRSSKGFMVATKNALFGRDSPSSRLRPVTENTLWRQGFDRMICSACSSTAVVRCRDEASGSWISPMKAP